MITFKIDGTELEMSKDTNVSFSFDNPIFGFDNIKLSRTQSFTIPKTPHNNTVFDFASRPDLYGDGMRKIYNAALHYSGGKVDGRLYISDAGQLNYNAVFVYGELLKLKEIKEAGKISEYLALSDSLDWDYTTPYSTDLPVSPISLRQYLSSLLGNRPQFMPTAGFKYLMDTAAAYFGVTIDYTGIEGYANSLAIKLNGMNSPNAIDDRFNVTRTGSQSGDSITIGGSGSSYFSVYELLIIGNFPATYKVLVANSDFYADIRITRTDEERGNYKYTQIRNSIAIATFTANQRTTTFTLKFQAGDRFTTANLDYSENKYESLNRYRNTNYNAIIDTYTELSEGGSLEFPSIYYLQPNLPDVTLVDLIKTLAYLTGRSIQYNNGVISFFDFTFDTEPVKLENNISFEKVTRNVGNFSQRNIIRYDSSDGVFEDNKLRYSYNIDNQTLEAENELYVIPFSEGNPSTPVIIGGRPVTSIPDIVQTQDGEYLFGEDADTICYFSGTHLTVPYFVILDEQLNLFSQSTTVEIKEKMYLFEFMKIRHNSLFIYKNNEYVVFSATWQKGVASLKLVKRR